MLVLLSGTSGAGKDTIKNELIRRMENVESLPSYTTRSQRTGDKPGITYHFVTKEQFEEMIKNNEFYEYNLHHENYYGTSRKIMNEKIADGKIIVKDMDVNGTENLVKLLKDEIKVVTIFLKVEKEELRKRLANREDKPSEKEMELRLSRMEYEESKIGSYDYVLINNNLEKTINIIMTIIKSEMELKDK